MKGRPVGSIIRNRITAILNITGPSYGYEIFKIYKEIFGKVHIRTIYYNLKKGIEKEEVILVKVARELGDYSWGDEVEKIYYTVGPYANINIPKEEIELINNIKLNNSEFNKIEVDWDNEIKNIIKELKKEIENYKEKYEVLSSQGKKLIKEKLIQKYEKLKEYSLNKISEQKLNEYLNNINPHTL